MDLKLKLDDMDYAHVHDVLCDLTNKKFTRQEIDEIIEQLPQHILGEAYAWGFSDTCVRDQIYAWFKENNND